MAKLLLLVPVFLLTLFIREGELLHCWMCSSDLYPPCSNLTMSQENNLTSNTFLKNCNVGENNSWSYPYLTSIKTICKKTKKIVQGTEITTRRCSFRPTNDYSKNCSTISEKPDVVITLCETCEQDGCNGA